MLCYKVAIAKPIKKCNSFFVCMLYHINKALLTMLSALQFIVISLLALKRDCLLQVKPLTLLLALRLPSNLAPYTLDSTV